MKKLLSRLILFMFPSCFDKNQSVKRDVKIIVFDFDGTLANTLPLAIKCINALSAEYGYKALEKSDSLELFRNKSMQEIVSVDLGLKFYQLPGYTTKAKKIFNENLKEVNVFAGVKEMLNLLASEYELAIITSNSNEAAKYALNQAGITCIKEIYSDSSIFGKHVVIKNFLKNRSLFANQIIYVGDEIRDIEACKKAGVKMIAVTWGYNSRRALEKSEPNYLVDSCEEVKQAVDKFKI